MQESVSGASRRVYITSVGLKWNSGILMMRVITCIYLTSQKGRTLYFADPSLINRSCGITSDIRPQDRLEESVKRDKNRVNVEKIQPDGTTGLILKVDAAFGEGSAALVKGTFYTEGADGKADVLQQGLFIDYPNEKDLTESILRNTQEFISGLESELDRINDPAATDARNVESPSYRKYIDPTSFVDYQLIQELADNGDAYFRSTFFHKEIGGRLQAGPIWDLDLAFGNVGWDMETPASDFKYNFMEGRPFFAQLNKDVNYKCLVVCRWNIHRVGGLSDEWFEGFFNENRALLSKGPSEREFKRWKTLGQYVPRVGLGFNSTAPSFYLESWEDEVDMLQKWVSMRLRFMDNVMQGQKEYLNCDCEYADEWAQIIE
ncbi:hypothetical protein SARC_14035 [Sphaeroforma arctica JP610]|uniref:CotH protein n=1 Tax=Sphaeroforma arctica JP610 TaxID=667725 RepID=A0A0L0FA33_9EUKA|nr:hypothetical protein SARC_14035 [Sphaeroforma arctica JP610]KNC73406.1 hypothetical protein SARC_14035 [Sphaeroforma arctica JP610]|eukprot:XP_014147308.1 hypothetical protein SARC_14035 [Sphaeroforma arctica JP610]